MRVAVRRLLIILAAASVLFATGPAAAGDGPVPDDQKLQDELRFRRDFGLTTDLAEVRALMADPTAYTTYPVALTPEERAEMERRLAMEGQMTPLEEAAEKMPNFAGHWIDQPAGGVIVVAFAGDAEKREPELRPLVPPGAELQVRNVKHTAAELEAVREQIKGVLSDLGRAGIRVGLLYTDLPTNRVIVGVVDLDSAATARLEALYRDAVATESSSPVATACTGRESCYGPPLRAGISVAPDNVVLHNRCSMAFLVRQGSYVQWLTAGHCAPSVNSTVWYHAGNGPVNPTAGSWPIGTIKATCWPQCNYSDAARGGNINNTYASKIVYGQGAPNGWPVNTAQGYNVDNVGDQVCLNARKAELWRCGTIQNDNAYICYEFNPNGTCKIWFNEMRTASYASMYGDSGGAVHSPLQVPSYSVVAYGVHSGCTLTFQTDTCDGFGIYSHIYRVSQELGVTVCSAINPCP
jgi:hypothetical protein